uniref:CSON008359 protein n=1 Tax=Culicoides sonorensis TaxID=179676 RepID=A0A336M426_CULSO
MGKTPKKKTAPAPPIQSDIDDEALFTPPAKQSFRSELKEALMKRNALTAKSKSTAISILDDIDSSPDATPMKPSELRRRAIEEIRSSEKRYISQLEILKQFFINPLKEKQLVDIKTHTSLFGQIEMIYNLNKELLDELETDLNNVSKAFLKLAPFFKLYSVYAFDYKNSLLVLQDETIKNPIFKQFLDETETRPEVQMKLNSLLITPIQRVPRYKLLLQQVLQYTSPSESDHKYLTESVKEIENTVQHINSVIEDQEHVQSLINLQNSLTNRSPSIVKPCRKILKEGVLAKVLTSGGEQKYYCVLMSDIFMYCKVLKKRPNNTVVENSLQCCCIYPLRKSKVSEMFSANFKLSCQGEGIIFHAENDLHCREWVQDIKQVIDMLVESRKTLRKESSRKRPVKKKQLKYFETEYILSPPQKGIKYDYENVFKYTDLASVENPSSNTKLKRNQKQKVPKIKISKSRDSTPKRSQTPEMRKSSTPTKQRPVSFPQPSSSSQSRFARVKSWFSFHMSSQSNKSKDSVNSDPTYGFASRASNNQTYFKTSNVDSSIPNDVDFKMALGGMLGEHCTSIDSMPSTINNTTTNNTQNMLTTPEAKDMLYPLRTSLDKVSSGKKRRQAECDENEKNTNYATKRVKFDDKEDVASESFFERRERIHAALYQQENNVPSFQPPPNRMSLKDKIVDFFSNLI